MQQEGQIEIENLVLEPKRVGPELFQVEVFPGRGIIGTKAFLRPKWYWGQTG